MSYSMDDQIRSDLKPMTTILPMLLKKINIVIDVLAIERITTTSKQSNSRSHWYVVEVDIAKSTMFIYDSDRSYFMDGQIRSDLKPMTTILPMLLKKINIVINAIAIEWITTTSKQSKS
ncbi:hypothetical protein Fot_11190 [Forsythia ovata]|uniref:Ubiquitin-like protease family profile domain-containing protein n=1 Tax=Forsythia ovata TaxID=205694 RepID=A0ABD1WIZ7_9LAMI